MDLFGGRYSSYQGFPGILPVFLPGKSHGQRSLVGYSPQGCKELDTTEVPWHAHRYLNNSYKYKDFVYYVNMHACMRACMFSVVFEVLQPQRLQPTSHEALLFMGFSQQEYWSGLLFPPPGDLPDPGIKTVSPAL